MGTGTGEVARAALGLNAGLEVIAGDCTLRMIEVGRRRFGGDRILWCCCDALELPFPEAAFDAVTAGYLLRNVSDLPQAIQEQVRVVKPGHPVVCLDTCPPVHGLLNPLIRFYLNKVIPLLGSLVAGHRAAYSYLPQSTQSFMEPDRLASIMSAAGLESITYRRFMFGTQVVLKGRKPNGWG